MPVSGTRAALHDTPNLVINGIQVQAENQFSKLTFCTVTACFVKHRFLAFHRILPLVLQFLQIVHKNYLGEMGSETTF